MTSQIFSVLEVGVALALIVGFMFEDRFAAAEERIFKRIRFWLRRRRAHSRGISVILTGRDSSCA